MALEYKTYTFDDTSGGRRKMERTIQHMAAQGWKVHSKETSQQGYAAGKTCCLGCLFLPLALLGKKDSKITVIFERDTEAIPTPTPAVAPAQTPATPQKTVAPVKPKASTTKPKKTNAPKPKVT